MFFLKFMKITYFFYNFILLFILISVIKHKYPKALDILTFGYFYEHFDILNFRKSFFIIVNK